MSIFLVSSFPKQQLLKSRASLEKDEERATDLRIGSGMSVSRIISRRWLPVSKIPDTIWKRIVLFREQQLVGKEPQQQLEGADLKSDDQIASVVSDAADPNVAWTQLSKDVQAENRRQAVLSPGFSFSAAGFLFPYHLGVCKSLMENNYITKDTPLAGSSAGALVCAVVAAGMTMEEALSVTKELAADCRENGTAFRLGAVLRKLLDKVMPEDAYEKASGRIRVAITQVFRSPRGLLVDEFESKEDLINALLTSSFIPGYLAPRPVTIFKNRICIDGGFTLFMPPTAAEKTVRVCAFSAKQLGLQNVVQISPDCNPENRVSTRELFNWAIEPAGDEILDQLYSDGYKDASAWAESNPVSNFRPSLGT